MKRFVLSALVCSALAVPGFAEDELFVVECPAEPEAPIAEVVVDVETTLEVEAPAADASDVVEVEVDEAVIDDAIKTDDSVEITATLEDGPLMTTSEEDVQRTDTEVDDPSIIYFSTTSTSTDTSSEVPLSVNQLADEQRNSLRLFSGREASREASSEKAGQAASLKELFAARATVKADAAAKTAPAIGAGEREVAKRKAEIDQLRDKALRTGDSALMAKANAMAGAQARGNAKARTFFGFGRK
jgi:hypothetical protein